jgi:hypothetical protein
MGAQGLSDTDLDAGMGDQSDDEGAGEEAGQHAMLHPENLP